MLWFLQFLLWNCIISCLQICKSVLYRKMTFLIAHCQLLSSLLSLFLNVCLFDFSSVPLYSTNLCSVTPWNLASTIMKMTKYRLLNIICQCLFLKSYFPLNSLLFSYWSLSLFWNAPILEPLYFLSSILGYSPALSLIPLP